MKRTLGAFHDTELDRRLRGWRIDAVVLAGLVINFGVESTGRAADKNGYRVVVVEDAMAGLEADAHEFASRRIFPHLGVVTTVEDLLAALVPGAPRQRCRDRASAWIRPGRNGGGAAGTASRLSPASWLAAHRAANLLVWWAGYDLAHGRHR